MSPDGSMFMYATVSRMRKSSSLNCVATEENPADQGTRGLLPEQLCDSLWLNGPDFLRGNLRNTNNAKFSFF